MNNEVNIPNSESEIDRLFGIFWHLVNANNREDHENANNIDDI